jgi:hypothetical protein
MIESIHRYPRTQHLEGSRLQPGDHDLTQVPLSQLRGLYCEIEEKLDGANAGISVDHDGRVRLQSRGHVLVGGERERHWDLFKRWAHAHEAALVAHIPVGGTLYGEWLYARFAPWIFSLATQVCLSRMRRSVSSASHAPMRSTILG